MLGWSPLHSLQNRLSPGSRCPPQSHDIVQFSPFKDGKPVLQPPHQIVIGFELGLCSDKSVHSQASESPRSVLDVDRPHSTSPRSPLSGLGSLLTGRECISKTVIGTEKLAKDDRAVHDVVESEHSVYVVGGLGPELHAHRPRVKSRASKDHQNERRRGRSHRRWCNAVLSSDEEDDRNDGVVVFKPRSIFSPGSPILHYSFSKDQGTDFLRQCHRCRRNLVEGKDIYMYRSDQAFCSQDCRYKQIAADECKHRSSVGTSCTALVSCGMSPVRATQAAFA